MTIKRALKKRLSWTLLMWQWRWMHWGDSLRLATKLLGDWWCHLYHIQPSLCHCGREWQGDCVVSRAWRDDMAALTDDQTINR